MPTKEPDYRLLIIDDNEAIHTDLKKILLPATVDPELLDDEELLFGKRPSHDLVFEIDSAFQGQEGLDLVESALASDRRYALAFVDVRMPPGWDGIETISRLWALDPALQVIICTAYSDYNWREIARRLGISHNLVVLKKPFDPIEVTQLAHALTAKWASALQMGLRMSELDRMVEERTVQLRLTVKELEAAKDLAEERTRQLLQSEELLSAAECLSHSGAWKWDSKTNTIELSQGGKKILGYPQQTLAVSDLMKCVHPDELQPVEQALKAATTSGPSFTFEHRIVRCDTGEVRIALASGRMVRDDSGNIVKSFGAIQDVTEERRVEEQFRQAQRMEAVGRLAGGVAHDFNNLLGVLMGLAELLLDKCPEGSRQRKYAADILDTVQRATQITRQLLDISRQQTGERAVANLHKVVSDAESLLRRLVGESITITTSLRATRCEVLANTDQLNQVIMNLAVNAHDAMPAGGCLRIETSDVPADGSAGKLTHPCVVLTVTDDGTGMDERVKAQIFDPFFTTKERGKGTGLGLSMVYGIVKSIGGDIEVWSEPGKGSSFSVFLPTMMEHGTHAAQLQAVTTESGSGTILLAEDEAGLRGILRVFLETGGYRVLEAEDVDDAIRLARSGQERIDLLVTDVVMPGLSGKVLAEKVNTLHPGLKVLFISGYTDNVLTEYDFVPEQTRFLQKPFSKDALLQKVAEVLRIQPPEASA